MDTNKGSTKGQHFSTSKPMCGCPCRYNSGPLCRSLQIGRLMVTTPASGGVLGNDMMGDGRENAVY